MLLARLRWRGVLVERYIGFGTVINDIVYVHGSSGSICQNPKRVMMDPSYYAILSGTWRVEPSLQERRFELKEGAQ
jgi:hypothetical protein